MKKRSLAKHVGIAFLILIVSYTLFTLFEPAYLPHPEEFSPFPDILAVLLILIACIKMGKQPRRWAYWGLFVVATLAFLDEIGYGTELFPSWHSFFYLPQYHIEIHDLHNLINFGVQLALSRLAELNWNGVQFFSFLLLDAALFFIGLLFVWLVRFRQAGAKEARWQARILRLAAAFIAVLGLAAAIYLFTLPTDPKNAVLVGQSLARLTSAAFTLVFSLLPLAFLIFKRAEFQKGVAKWLEKSRFAAELPALLFVLILLTIVYQLYVPFVFLPDQIARLERVTPLFVWALAELFILWLAALAWDGHYRKPLLDLWRRFIAFLTREPAFFYVAFGVALIFVAQLNDAGILPISEWIQTPNFHVKDWGLWTEEIFEMTSGYEFIAAWFFFPKPKT